MLPLAEHFLKTYAARAGKRVAVRNAPTEMGRVSAAMAFTADGAELTIQPEFHHPPRHVVVRIPYSVELDSFTSDAARAFRKDDLLVFTPDATKATLRWRGKPGVHEGNFQDILKGYRSEYYDIVRNDNYDPAKAGKPFLLDDEKDHPAEPLSFDLVRRAFLKEYGRRFAEQTAAGDRPYTVEPPAVLSAAERAAMFQSAFKDFLSNAATGCKAASSASLPDHGPELAVDGIVSLESSWQADPYPQWLQLDLGKPTVLKGARVWTYWGGGRYYRYTVEASIDGKNWTLVGDKSANEQPATEKGDLFEFPPREVRYLRVNMLFHSLNGGVHLVEIAPY